MHCKMSSKYSLDYSRFDNIDCSSSEDEETVEPQQPEFQPPPSAGFSPFDFQRDKNEDLSGATNETLCTKLNNMIDVISFRRFATFIPKEQILIGFDLQVSSHRKILLVTIIIMVNLKKRCWLHQKTHQV